MLPKRGQEAAAVDSVDNALGALGMLRLCFG
jgi:hypothetical protein